MFYWLVKNLVLGPLLMRVFRPWVKGMENVPATGAAILASNHLSFVDSIFLPLVLKRPVTFLAKAEYFTGRGVKGWLVRQFFIATGQIPIDRSGGQASEDSLNTGLRVLSEGRLLGIYPEGTRSPDAKLYRGRTGIARMALEAKVPIIPVAMIDTDKVMPIGSTMPSVKRVGVLFGQPLDFSRFDGYENDRFVLRAITDEIMVEIHHLSEKEYADEYASSARARVDG
ncbi:MAG: 1-acyl-sn-glycerol-3-phosphate acyltransferase [Actinobacteria bacterium]|uniref:Unannotated protein n=1 Tax=freshwater metagenome TaxID=449393 RepID=A0A6J6FQQ5_9ZZZZ|nr:1-acyl-sn-glycerol-3-phosphate acyltransferase [Actinomycetota bacterium]